MIVVAVIMIFVIPTFAKIFGEMNETPLPTRIVIDASKFLGGFGGFSLFVGLITLGYGIRQYRNTEGDESRPDRILLKLPIFGDLLVKGCQARFTRTLGTLVSSGVPILDSLDICAKSSGNKVIEQIVIGVKNEVTTGKTIAEPLSQSEIFPPMVSQMIHVGESTGALDQMLNKVADFYDDEVDQAVTNLTTMLEPMLMVFLGVVIGFIVVALYLPIFKMGEVIGK
ncbi:MAG: type II secretion system F family protein [Desulfobacterales bacterium]|nr:type II secretion system F family protein [Desulfobacterales bacterium]